LKCEDWELELDYEMEQFIEETIQNLSNFCPRCGSFVLGNFCSRCKKSVPTEKYFDPDFEDYFNIVEKQDEEFNTSLSKKDSWEEVEG
jgi:ribosomal protein S27AE